MTFDLSARLITRDALLGRCKTCQHEGRNRGKPLSGCDVKGWNDPVKNPGASCRYHEHVQGMASRMPDGRIKSKAVGQLSRGRKQ